MSILRERVWIVKSDKTVRTDETEPMALTSYLAKLGTSDPIEAHVDIQSLIDSFDIKNFSSASVQFSLSEVYKLNSKVLLINGDQKCKHYKANPMIVESCPLPEDRVSDTGAFSGWLQE
ncbi:Glutamate--tRNA ligase 1 [Araneus ventricosus]|uniref:Glutamate--tRNA ligase 1 n=1 Tax=Araneus ventricosus TaxID=182803 RepID=A0A4Y2TTN3_ARAVE|nr:Glutamate--tRNA ligase 1 [Araneus ventricosus]